MTGYLEGIVLLFPPDAGGRQASIAPREGTYRVFAGFGMVRFIEGPPILTPGGEARVVMEVESPLPELQIASGAEVELVEGERVVGRLTVTRFWRNAVAV